MTSSPSYSRNRSSVSLANTTRAYSPTSCPHIQQYRRSALSDDTAYNGSEGHIHDRTTSADYDRTIFDELQIATPPRAATPIRPALGSRLLSSLSNSQPAAAALSRKGSVLHSRAKSLAGFVPKLSTSNTSTPDRAPPANRIFGDLFHGVSAPIRIGAPVSPTKEKEESEFVMDYRPTFTERPSSMLRRSTASSQTSLPLMSKPTSWFGRRTTNPTPAKQQPQDELATLNINASLFPNGAADPLDPAAFNDLLLNATSLLQRMQMAYKEKLDYIANIQPEMDAQREETEEVETRSQHLKMQLEDMARQAQQQESAMQDMALQLAEEKIKVAQEAREAAKTIRIVPNAGGDRDFTPRQRKRRSTDYASDSGFESDMESVFSGHSSVETPISPVSNSVSYLPNHGRTIDMQSTKGEDRLQRRPTVGKGAGGTRLGGEGAAWATVESLRNENHDLRREMDDMQRTLQGCIDLVSGVGGV